MAATPKVSDKVAGFITFYASSLAVPARRAMENPEVQQGARLVSNTGCAACHTPKHTTGLVADRQTSATRRSGPAILWHGGEAEISREQFKARFRTERAVLMPFLKVPEEAPGCTKV